MLLAQVFTEPFLFIVPAVGLVWLTYEPVLTTRSGTIGQRVMGIRVRDGHDPFKKISLLSSYIRFIVKVLLGLVSFITIHRNEQKRALHDLAAVSVMVCPNPEFE